MKNIQLLTLIGTTLAGILHSTAAQAFTFSLNSSNSGSGIFSYDVTLAANETLNPGDPLALTGLAGVTNVTANSNPYSLASLDSFDDTSANFIASGTFTGSQVFANAISLNSFSPTGNINYSAFSSGTAGGSFAGITQGPVDATAVPFELSPDLGIFTIFGIVGLNYYRKKFKSQK